LKGKLVQTLPNPSNRASSNRYAVHRYEMLGHALRRYEMLGQAMPRYATMLIVPALAIFLAACVPGIVEPPTPFSAAETVTLPTPEQPTIEASPIPEQSAEPPEPTATARVARPSQPVPEPHLEQGQPVVIDQIWMDSATDGWAIGSHPDAVPAPSIHVLRTRDGGQTWAEVTPPEDSTFMSDIGGMVSSGSNAWLIYLGTDRIWRTVDGGATWTASEAGYPMGQLSSFDFTDSEHGWMLREVESGFGSQLVALFRTIDGGDTWQEIINPYESEDLQSCRKTGISFFGTDTGWVTYDCEGSYLEAFLDVSDDAGQSWMEGQLPLPKGAAESTDQGWCSSSSPRLTGEISGSLIVTCMVEQGSGLTRSSYLYQTEDAGSTWVIHEYPGGEPHYFSDGTILALGRDQYLSTDGGERWAKIKTVNWDGQYSFVDPSTGWAVAKSDDEIALVVTSNGGRTWEIIEPLIASE
jgi:photosystem II stability/assembly factor-like uncharacterized protein